MSDSTDFDTRVMTLIAETFSVPASSLTRATTADDVDGWDSLGHSILLTRLSQRLDIEIDEDVAAHSRDVGDLIDALKREVDRRE